MNRLDFDRAFPPTPDCIPAAIELGFRKGQKHMKMRNKIIAMGSIAAALAVMLAAALALTIGPSPAPDLLAQPPLTQPTKETATVYSTDGSAYYHAVPDCSGLETAAAMPEPEAVAMGKKPCPACISLSCGGHEGEEIEFVYHAPGAKYFHKQAECSGGTMPLKEDYRTLVRAYPGKEPCPECFPLGVRTCLHGRTFIIEPEPTAMPAPEDHAEETEYASMPQAEEYHPVLLKEDSPEPEESQPYAFPVYTEYGASLTTYHKLQNCGGGDYRRKITEEQAIQENLQYCEACYWGLVYYTEQGNYYHSDRNCQGMRNAKAHSREEARLSRKLPCPLCLMLYCRDGGSYFHLLPDCMGMMDAELHTLTDLQAMESIHIRCPVCLSPETVYAAVGGKYFHSFSSCSGMENAKVTDPETAWNNGQSPCWVCITGENTRTLVNPVGQSFEPAAGQPVWLPENHDLFVTAFGKSINQLMPGYSYDHTAVEQDGSGEPVLIWKLKNDYIPDEEPIAFCGLSGVSDSGRTLAVNLSDNLPGEGGNNAQFFLRDAFVRKNGMDVSLSTLCNYAQLCVNEDVCPPEDRPDRLSVSGVKVYFDVENKVSAYDVRYLLDERQPYILRSTIGDDGRIQYELLKDANWL